MDIIVTRDLTKEFNGLTAVDGVSFSVKKGEIFGFLGPNGAGKSTTINILTTLLLPTRGTATVNGYDILTQQDDVRRSIGIVSQDVVLENELTARENLILHGEVYGMARREIEERIPRLLKLVELEGREDSRVKTFSGGMKRRLEIVKSFLHKPEIIFMDEPTTGLDPQSRRVVWDHINYLNKEEGVTIFLTTHYMDEADYLCHRIGIMDFGRLLDLDTPENLKNKIGAGDLVDIGFTGDGEAFVREVQEGCGWEVRSHEPGHLRIAANRAELSLMKLVRIAEETGVTIDSLSVREPTLEDVFIHYTGRAIREQAAENVTRAVLRRLR
ncbi:MAG: ATP-binding cassette domain-containing protein [Euryarchaeota archaeon]|nr:ATP-binding cassette domain-containing protein [Euryarchaeota archaeon]